MSLSKTNELGEIAKCKDRKYACKGNGQLEKYRYYTRGASVTISNLPVEILDYIFSYLSVKERLRTELVCLHWRRIGKTIPWRWPRKLKVSELKAHYGKGAPMDNILPSILSRCGANLQQLTLSLSTEESDFKLGSKVFSSVGQHCPNLTDFRGDLLESEDDPGLSCHLISLAKGCTKLKQVHLGHSLVLDDASLAEFLKLCPFLEYLVLGHNRSLTHEFVKTLNRKLKGFYVYNFSMLCMYTYVARELMDTCDSIEGLAIIDDDSNDLTVANLIELIRYYKNTLKTLYFDKFFLEQSSEWFLIPSVLQQLEVLSFSSCFIGDNFMSLVVKECRQLRALNIAYTNVTDEGIAALADAPSLRILDISGLCISGTGIRRVANEGRLEKLLMQYIGYLQAHECYMEESCIILANCCQNLHVLDVNENKFISNRLVDEFSSSLDRGFLKNPVTLYVAKTKVTKRVKRCDKLNLSFEKAYVVEEFNHLTGFSHGKPPNIF